MSGFWGKADIPDPLTNVRYDPKRARAGTYCVGNTDSRRSLKPLDQCRYFGITRMTELQSTILCPQCGYAATGAMPTNACVLVYECARCGARLQPRQGDCCVFCSYGSVPCSPGQAQRAKRRYGA